MKKIIKSNFRVAIYPKTTFYGITVAEEENVCREILLQAKRHIDNTEIIVIEFDSKEVCDICGREWENPPYCCDKAMQEYGMDKYPIEHSTEEDYQHFLSYSGLSHSDDLRKAYFAGAGK